MAYTADSKSAAERRVGSSPTKDIHMDAELERIRSTIALLNFARTFADYIKECDPQLYARARQYAIDTCEKVEGIDLDLTDKNKA